MKEDDERNMSGNDWMEKNIFHGSFRFSWIGTMLEITFPKNKLLKINYTILYKRVDRPFSFPYLHHLKNWQRERISVVKSNIVFLVFCLGLKKLKNFLMNSSDSLDHSVIPSKIPECKPANNLQIFSWTHLISIHFKN